MSKLDELIAEFCPNGVKYRRVGDIADYEQPSKYLVKSADYNDNFETPVLTAGQTFILGYTNEKEGIYNASPENPVIIFDDFTGAFKWVDFPFKAKSSAMKMITSNSDALIRYLYHLMGFLNYSSDEHKRLWISVYSELQVPVPPLEVQREIVHILDSFTLLTAELTAELTARKRQYEFYRDKLLSHDGIYPMKPLAELGKWSGGKTPSMSEKSFWEQGTIPWISSKDMKSSTLEDTQDHITEKAIKEASMTVYPANSIAVVTRSGILKHTFPVAYVPFETTINQDIKMLVVNEDILPRYAFYIIQGKGKDILVKTKKQGGTVDSLDFQKVLAYKVPVPPKDIQSKVVEVLDNFEAICTDLNIGLPAEIEARQKQYEYYRDLLLTFVETNGNLLTDRQTDRQTELNAIKLIQYVFGYATVKLMDVAEYSKDRINAVNTNARNYVGVDNLLQNRQGKTNAKYVPTEGNLTKYFKEDVLIGNIRPYLRKIWFANCFGGTNGDVLVIRSKNNIDVMLSKFMYYVLSDERFFIYDDNNSKGAKMPRGNKKAIMEYEFYLPTIEKQKSIISILDRFDTLCNDLSAGLPAEIEARQKQYEYYRDKLLSFKELSKIGRR